MRMGFEPKRLRKEYKNQPVTAYANCKVIKFRSKLEYRWANYLEFLKLAGEIKDWAYESHTFHFDNIGVVSWLIDFTIRNNDDTFEYHECKGHFEKRDVDKLKCLFKERPEVKVTYIFASKPKLSVIKWGYLNRYCERVITNAQTITKKMPTYF